MHLKNHLHYILQQILEIVNGYKDINRAKTAVFGVRKITKDIVLKKVLHILK